MEDQAAKRKLAAYPTSLLQGIGGSKEQTAVTLPKPKLLSPHPTHLRHPHSPGQANVLTPQQTQVKAREVPLTALDDNPEVQAGERLIFLC